jgi:hypothetical protein
MGKPSDAKADGASEGTRAAGKPALPPFHHTEAYPDAGSVFGMTLAPLEEVKNRAIIVLDTNVLLVPYTVNSKSLEAIRSTYQQLRREDRLFIPAQVAREFAAHRATKLGEMFSALNRVLNSVRAPEIGEYPLLGRLDEYQQLGELERELKAKLQAYHKALGTVIDKVRAWRWDDPVSALYREIFTPEVVAEQDETRDETEKFLSHRRANRLAPGYKDAGKDDGGVGDALIWRTILHLGSTKKTDVIFVSLDEKPDWWHRSEKLPLYPRFDLANEFWRTTNGHTFHQVRFSDMLALFEAPKDVVAEVRQEEASTEVPAQRSGAFGRGQRTGLRAIHAVAHWISARFSIADLVRQNRFPDLLAEVPKLGTVGIEVKLFRPGGRARLGPVIWEALFTGGLLLDDGSIDALLLVVVAEDEIESRHAANVLHNTLLKIPENASTARTSYVVGYLDADGDFILNTEILSEPIGNSRERGSFGA